MILEEDELGCLCLRPDQDLVTALQASPVSRDHAGGHRTLLLEELSPARLQPSPGGRSVPQEDHLQGGRHISRSRSVGGQQHQLGGDPVLPWCFLGEDGEALLASVPQNRRGLHLEQKNLNSFRNICRNCSICTGIESMEEFT